MKIIFLRSHLWHPTSYVTNKFIHAHVRREIGNNGVGNGATSAEQSGLLSESNHNGEMNRLPWLLKSDKCSRWMNIVNLITQVYSQKACISRMHVSYKYGHAYAVHDMWRSSATLQQCRSPALITRQRNITVYRFRRHREKNDEEMVKILFMFAVQAPLLQDTDIYPRELCSPWLQAPFIFKATKTLWNINDTTEKLFATEKRTVV